MELARMNREFSATLEMLGGGRRRQRTQSSPAHGSRPIFRADRISEVTESNNGEGGLSGDISALSTRGVSTEDEGFPELRPRPGSQTDSIASEEVMGKLDLDEEQRRSSGR